MPHSNLIRDRGEKRENVLTQKKLGEGRDVATVERQEQREVLNFGEVRTTTKCFVGRKKSLQGWGSLEGERKRKLPDLGF